jgi:Uma2 family endonuclease
MAGASFAFSVLKKACPFNEPRITMTAMPAAKTMSADEFIALPVPDHGRPWNLIDGEVVVNEPTPLHMTTLFDIAFALRRWVEAEGGCGGVYLPIDVKLDERNVYAPDVLWYAEGRVPARDARAPSPLPDIAAEVRSPSTWRYDIGAKKAGYERHGLRELWLVDTAADEVLLFRRSAPGQPSFDVAVELTRDDVLTSPLLPGFSLALADLFAD